MKDNSKVLRSFSQFSWSLLVHFGMFLILILYNCPLFDNPPVSIVDFKAAVADLQNKGVEAMGKDSIKIRLRDDAYLVLVRMTGLLATYVDMVSQGVVTNIMLSGFSVYSPEGHSGIKIFTVIRGLLSGSVIARWPKFAKAHSYVVRYALNVEGFREIYTQAPGVGITECNIDGLIKSKEYMFQMAVVYSDSQSAWSDPVYLVVS